ncbi:MAG: apolipoprotein N-acyltransferase [Actinomycetota bacterium]|nr:apolipoprotein N-acyltransferase [Actinomycetota bacterium]
MFLSFKELGFFAWFALLPFLFVVYKSNLKQAVIAGVICGIAFFAGVTYWMNVLPVRYTWLLLTPILSIGFVIFGIKVYFIYTRIRQPYIRMFLIPAAWILIEFLRSQTRLAFTIGILGYSQHSFLPLMQITRFTGIYGVSFIILLFNVAIFETIKLFAEKRKVNFKFLIISISILVMFSGYGIISVNNNLNRVIKNKNNNEINVAAVLPDIKLGDKYKEGGLEIIPDEYGGGSYFKEGTDLVIFPESMIWGTIDENKDFKNWMKKFAEEEKVYFLIGQYVQDEDSEGYYNSAFLYNPDLEIAGRYDEINPVPFSQYIPYRKFLGFLKFLDFSEVDLITGSEYNAVEYDGKGKLGINICYESTIPSIAGNMRKNGAEALIIVSDSSSLDNSMAPWHHIIFSKVRAIENGCYAVHCANVGISAVISPAGEIMVISDLSEKKVIYESIYLNDKKTFYSKFGNMIMFIYFSIISLVTIAYLVSIYLKKTSTIKRKSE